MTATLLTTPTSNPCLNGIPLLTWRWLLSAISLPSSQTSQSSHNHCSFWWLQEHPYSPILFSHRPATIHLTPSKERIILKYKSSHAIPRLQQTMSKLLTTVCKLLLFWLRNTIYGHMGASRTTLGHTVLWIMIWLLGCGAMPCIAYLTVRSSPTLPTSPDSSVPLWWMSGWFNVFILLCFFFLISYPPNLGPPTESKLAFKLGWPNVANKMQDT